uniref:Uncharacterized protein n=1 Tax=Vespula pensylvanica TaxID=30213 RepID=A0A834U445_VESPE|nr:hypothetical protein H0235_012223 [Vespula pensylvanica]
MLAQHDYDDRPSASVLTVYAFHSDTAIGNATVGIDAPFGKEGVTRRKETPTGSTKLGQSTSENQPSNEASVATPTYRRLCIDPTMNPDYPARY